MPAMQPGARCSGRVEVAMCRSGQYDHLLQGHLRLQPQRDGHAAGGALVGHGQVCPQLLTSYCCAPVGHDVRRANVRRAALEEMRARSWGRVCSKRGSGFDGRWTQDPNALDNSFYSDLAKSELSWTQGPVMGTGKVQWCVRCAACALCVPSAHTVHTCWSRPTCAQDVCDGAAAHA